MNSTDIRLSRLELFQARMGDIRISRHPLRQDVLFMVKDTEFDIYQDGSSVELVRVYKEAIVRRSVDMYYVQEAFGADVLVEDGDKLPWVVCLTCLGLPRLPMLKDQFLIGGMLYTVSAVRPVNRDARAILECLVYPERSGRVDTLQLYGVSLSSGGSAVTIEDAYTTSVVVRLLWGGSPESMSWDKKVWLPFAAVSEQVVPRGATHYYLRDAGGVVAAFSFGGVSVPLTGFEDMGYVGKRDSTGASFLFPVTEGVYVNS